MNYQKLQEYFNENKIKIGDDFQVKPPLYYTSLHDAYRHYFMTFRDVKDLLWFQLQSDLLERKNFMFQFKARNENVVFTILSFHRFFELFLKDVLEKLNPYLKVKFPQKEKDVIAYIDGQLNPNHINTIEAGDTIKRIIAVFQYYKDKPEYLSLKPYEFLSEKFFENTFKILTEWRNRILHNGNTVINVIALDYLVSQRIIPLSNQIIEIQGIELQFDRPYFFKTKTGIDVIDEILKIKFSYDDFNNPEQYSQLRTGIMKLGHYKEIGRAAFNDDFLKRENISYYEEKYKDPIRRSERFANSEKEADHFNSIHNCFCCGANSLVVYKHIFTDNIVFKKEIVTHWAKCYHCDYSIGSEVGDPHIFDICNEPLFT